MTTPTTTAKKTATTPKTPATPAATDQEPPKAAPAKKTIARKADATTKPEFAPVVSENGRMNHANCGHPRTLPGRAACRAAYKAANAK